MVAKTWSEDINILFQSWYDFRYEAITGLAGFFVLHFLSGYVLSTFTNWIDATADTLKKSDEKKGKKVKADAVYFKKAKWETSIKCVALFHAIISSAVCIYGMAVAPSWMVTYEWLWEKNENKRNAIWFSACYFLYDLVIAIVDLDPAFLVHGSMASSIYLHSASTGFGYNLGVVFNSFEISTIFLNIRALMIASQNTKNALFPIIEKLFFASFILVRDVFGLIFAAFNFMPAFYQLLNGNPEIPHCYSAVILFMFANTAINVLNVIWTAAMIKIAFGGGKKDKKPVVAQQQKKD